MNDHAHATTTAAGATDVDTFAEALANLSAAGISFTEVARCPVPGCPACRTRTLPHAA